MFTYGHFSLAFNGIFIPGKAYPHVSEWALERYDNCCVENIFSIRIWIVEVNIFKNYRILASKLNVWYLER